MTFRQPPCSRPLFGEFSQSWHRTCPSQGKPLISAGFPQSTRNFPFILLPPLIALMVLRGFNGSTFATHSEPAVNVWKRTGCRRRGSDVRKRTCGSRAVHRRHSRLCYKRCGPVSWPAQPRLQQECLRCNVRCRQGEPARASTFSSRLARLHYPRATFTECHPCKLG